MENTDKITLNGPEGDPLDLFVLEETRVNGMDYLLATDKKDDEDGECYVLKDTAQAGEKEAVYEFVTDDDELDYMFQIFRELMEDSGVDLSR